MAGFSVTVGQEGNKEIDFIAQKSGEKIYVQVAYMLTNEETINREFGNLLEIRDNYPKYVVTMDEMTETTTYEGIKRIHVKDFCLNLVRSEEHTSELQSRPHLVCRLLLEKKK